jgi:hypothetical protein
VQATPRSIETDIPARLDRLPWGRWPLLVVVSLGITWLLDGLEGSAPDRWRELLFRGRLAGALAMIVGGVVEVFLGVDAEGKSLESVSAPVARGDGR